MHHHTFEYVNVNKSVLLRVPYNPMHAYRDVYDINNYMQNIFYTIYCSMLKSLFLKQIRCYLSPYKLVDNVVHVKVLMKKFANSGRVRKGGQRINNFNGNFQHFFIGNFSREEGLCQKSYQDSVISVPRIFYFFQFHEVAHHNACIHQSFR